MTTTNADATREVRYGMILETTTEYGCAARKNRGRFAGHKIHRLRVTRVVGLEDPNARGSFAEEFRQLKTPVVFACHPTCGCTSGQNAGRPVDGLTAADVTCDKCR